MATYLTTAEVPTVIRLLVLLQQSCRSPLTPTRRRARREIVIARAMITKLERRIRKQCKKAV